MNRQEAEELLPWFVAGTLSDDESRAVQAFIDSGEISKAELNEVALFAETVSEQSAHEPAYNPAILQNAMTELDTIVQEPAEEPVIVREPVAEPGLFERLKDFFRWDETPAMAKVAIGAQFAAVLALAVFVASPDNGGAFFSRNTGDYEVVSGTTTAARADLTLAFTPGISLDEVTALLTTVEGRIVDGPNSLGMYSIALPEGADLDAARATLEASALTTFVQPAAQP